MSFSHKHKQNFLDHIGAKTSPNDHEKELLKEAQAYAKMVSWLPGLRMIAVCNSLSFFATHEDSDIDFFVVTEPGRMWLVRIYMTLLYTILGVRRRNLSKVKSRYKDVTHHYAGKICLSFFCTTDVLDLGPIALRDDIYLHMWMNYLQPIVDIDGTLKLFHEANELKREGIAGDVGSYCVISRKSRKWEGWRIFGWIDSFLRSIFLPRTLRSYTSIGKPFGVVIHDHMLKFHDQDRREKFRETIL